MRGKSDITRRKALKAISASGIGGLALSISPVQATAKKIEESNIKEVTGEKHQKLTKKAKKLSGVQ
ncbi:hypothetical protein [Haloferax elongans]|uniref:hypothetical protein n=1 Tax=Haloferax elongans TaxID=403191 RepID=UPI0012670B24|nr:hypothetical protein [Haloferax elongans]